MAHTIGTNKIWTIQIKIGTYLTLLHVFLDELHNQNVKEHINK